MNGQQETQTMPKPKTILRRKIPLEPWQLSRLSDVRENLALHRYGETYSKAGFTMANDIKFLLEVVDELRETLAK